MTDSSARPLIIHRLYGYLLPGLGLAIVCLLLAACSPGNDDEQATGEPAAEMDEVPSGPAIRRTVPFISLRDKTGSTVASEYFGSERGTVHTGYCDISWTPFPLLESIASNLPFYIPQGTMQLESVYEVDAGSFWRDPVQGVVGDHPLFYVHGYNVGFEKGCSRAALFQENLQLGSRFLLFSWPSDDAVLNYTHDEADIYWSVAYIEQSLQRMVESFGVGNIDVVGHSLGTRGIYLALVRMSDQHSGESPLLNQLVLIAADIDAGIFRQYLALIRPLVRNLTIYVSDNDNALALSEEVHGYPRLGRTGPHLQGLDGVEIIDVSATGRRRASGHLYHLHNNTVINDLDQLLNKNRLAMDRSGLQQDPELGPDYWRLLPAKEN